MHVPGRAPNVALISINQSVTRRCRGLVVRAPHPALHGCTGSEAPPFRSIANARLNRSGFDLAAPSLAKLIRVNGSDDGGRDNGDALRPACVATNQPREEVPYGTPPPQFPEGDGRTRWHRHHWRDVRRDCASGKN